MNASKRGLIRLGIVSAAAAGLALVSPTVAVAVADSDPVGTSPVEVDPNELVVEETTTEPIVVELVIETEAIEAPTPGEPSSDETDPGAVVASDHEVVDRLQAPGMPDVGNHADGDDHDGGNHDGDNHDGDNHDGDNHDGDEHGNHDGDDHGDGHTGGGGTGDPYRMTFAVSWRLPDDTPITVLDDTLPTDWRTVFDLAAASATGSGKPTSAHCTYPQGSSELVCEFVGPGHGSGSGSADGMIVPAKKTATYTVTVLWPTDRWSIDGANAGPYSARTLCPRGGDQGGHADHGGHDSADGASALTTKGSVCLHTVVMRRSAVTPEPPPPPTQPPTQPPATDPVVIDGPASVVPASAPAPARASSPAAVAPVAATASAAPRQLPATGSSVDTMMMIGAIALALGSGLSLLARRQSTAG